MNEHAVSAIRKILGEKKLKTDEPMSWHTSCKIGGPASLYYEADTTSDLVLAFTSAHKLHIPVFVFGGGSGIIVSDNGFNGLVIKNNTRKFDIFGMSGKVINHKIDFSKTMLLAESGSITNQIVRFTIEKGFSGLEYQLGIPGTIGGAIFMNALYLPEKVFIRDSVYEVKTVDVNGNLCTRQSTYFSTKEGQNALQNNEELIISVTFLLHSEDTKTLWERGGKASEYRSTHQPNALSMGYAFSDISLSDAMRVPTPQHITCADFLIDNAGLRSKKYGDAAISSVNPNFITNNGNATAEDVAKLVAEVKQTVQNKFGVSLQLHGRWIGF